MGRRKSVGLYNETIKKKIIDFLKQRNMLYAHDKNNSSALFKTMVKRVVEEYDSRDSRGNIVFKQTITTIISDAKKLKNEEIDIFQIDSSYFQEIVFLANNAQKLFAKKQDDMNKKEYFEALLELLHKIK